MVDTTGPLAPRQLDQLRRSCGEVITPDDATYDEARPPLERDPRSAARGHRPPDERREVATAIRFAREHDLEIAVRSGGHSAAGLAGPDGGLVVDLSAMRGVEVDPRARIARANGGALLGELDVAAQAHGLVCPIGVVGHTGRRRADARWGRRPPPAPLRAHDRQPRPPSSSSPPTAGSSARPRPRSPSSSGACAAPAGTSGSRRRSSSGSSRSGPTSTAAS